MKKALLLVAAPLLLFSFAAYAPQGRKPNWMPAKGMEVEVTLVTGEKVTGEVEFDFPTFLLLLGGRGPDRGDGSRLSSAIRINPDHVVFCREISRKKK